MPIDKSYIPQPLRQVGSSFELVRVMLDVVEAHRAYCEAGVLHGRICPEVIMRVPGTPSARGILIDFDYPRDTRAPASTERTDGQSGSSA